jgi:hypothetical protein
VHEIAEVFCRTLRHPRELGPEALAARGAIPVPSFKVVGGTGAGN